MEPQDAVTLSKSLYESAERAAKGTEPLDVATVKALSKRLCKLTQAAERTRISEKNRAVAELDVLRSEMHSELVDREANSARVAERQRFLFERSAAQNGQASAAERAAQSAAFVESALVSLCPHTTARSPGCSQLAELHDHAQIP